MHYSRFCPVMPNSAQQVCVPLPEPRVAPFAVGWAALTSATHSFWSLCGRLSSRDRQEVVQKGQSSTRGYDGGPSFSPATVA